MASQFKSDSVGGVVKELHWLVAKVAFSSKSSVYPACTSHGIFSRHEKGLHLCNLLIYLAELSGIGGVSPEAFETASKKPSGVSVKAGAVQCGKDTLPTRIVIQ